MFTAFDHRKRVGLVGKQWFRKDMVVVLGMGDALSRPMGGRP